MSEKSDKGEKLIINPVLNFLTRVMNDGLKIEVITATALSFFTLEQIIEAKAVLHKELKIETRLIKHSKKEDENVIDMCRWFNQAATRDKKLIPTFVILTPCSVPTVGESTSATAICRLNEIKRKVDGLYEMAQNRPLTWKPSEPAEEPPLRPSYAVVLKNLPDSLNTPSARKEFIDKVCPNSEEISELRKLKGDWKLVVKSKKTADTIASTLKSDKYGVTASVRSPSYIGVLKRVPEDLNEQSLHELIPRATKVMQCGSSRAFKVYFESRHELEIFVRNSIKVHYEKLPAEVFVFTPRRCYSCHTVGHLASECTNQPKCSRCGSVEHTSDRLNPCKQPLFCISCNTSGHSCYSVRCSANKPANADSKANRLARATQ